MSIITMDSTSTSSCPSSTSNITPIAQWKYDVFLCFRGDDTRRNFTGHLYLALRGAGVIVFRDDEHERGQPIQEILQVIKESKISLIIFSKDFASSSFCLDELVAICKCVDEGRHTALPVFYHVDPSEVQGPEGRYKEAFAKHEEAFTGEAMKKVDEWRDAMIKVANNAGWEVDRRRDEADSIQEIVGDILSKLKRSSYNISNIANCLVGMDAHLERMRQNLDIGNLSVVRFIGICGIGGIGKTTIARVVYEEISPEFEGGSFLSDVREACQMHGLVRLQEQLLSDTLVGRNVRIGNQHGGMVEIQRRLYSRRVLIVLDDVDQLVQLQFLVGVGDPDEWFAPGSRIIITTRDEHLLRSLGRADTTVYRVEGLNADEALRLFCLKAFGNECPQEEYLKLSHDYVSYANNLPLALVVLGSFLCGRSVKEWKSALDRLQEVPHREIDHKLRLSFDGLEELEKKIFLDIACFFKGEYRDCVIEVLNSCGFYADIGLRVLIDKSLITILNNRVWMHDLLQKLGRDIVWQEHREAGQRSRLWLQNDIIHALNNDTTDTVEGIAVDSYVPKDLQFSREEFLHMKNLKASLGRHRQDNMFVNGESFLKMKNLRILKANNMHPLRGYLHLPNTLRYLEWQRYPFQILPSRFVPDKLVELHMPCSEIAQLWKGAKQSLVMLKVMNLGYCENLTETPNFSLFPNLEKLILEGCRKLLKVHDSIKDLKGLVSLNLQGCRSLILFPDDISDMKSLKILNFLGCSGLKKLPELGSMTCLQELYASDIAAGQLPSVSSPSHAMSLKLPSLSGLCSLRELWLAHCKLKEDAIPSDLSYFPLLETLNLEGNDFESIPSSIIHMFSLKDLDFTNCRSLKSLPELPLSITRLTLVNCVSLTLLQNLGRLSKLESLDLTCCKSLRSVMDLPLSVKEMNTNLCISLEKFPCPCELRTSSPWHLSFAKCNTLDEIQVVMSWLKSYLHTLKENKHQKNGELLMLLPRSRVLALCDHRVVRSPLEVHLPSCWCNEKFLGFIICATMDFGRCSPSSVSGNLYAHEEQGRPPKHLGAYHSPANQLCRPVSDHLWFLFIPRDSSRSIDWWNAFSLFQLKAFSLSGCNVKNLGFHIVYEQDVEKLVSSSAFSKILDLPGCSKSEKRRRSKDDSCFEGKLVSNEESGNFLEFVLNGEDGIGIDLDETNDDEVEDVSGNKEFDDIDDEVEDASANEEFDDMDEEDVIFLFRRKEHIKDLAML